MTWASVGHPVVSDIVTTRKVSSVIPFLKRSRGEFLARRAIRDSIAAMKSSGPVLTAEVDEQLMTVSIACVVWSRASKLVKRPVSFSIEQSFKDRVLIHGSNCNVVPSASRFPEIKSLLLYLRNKIGQ